MNGFLGRVVLSGIVFFCGISSDLLAQSSSLASEGQPTVVVSSSPTSGISSPSLTPAVTIMPTPVSTVQTSTTRKISTQMPEVVITANRLDTPVSQVSSSLTVITADQIEKKQAQTVNEALEGVPGLDTAQNGPEGENTSVYIRGGNPECTLVLMDGVPLNDPVGSPASYDFLDQITTGDVKQIEVVRGPQSTLFGSNAMGGVINIITQSGPSPLGGSIWMEGGSYGTSQETVAAHGGDSNGYFNLNISHFNDAGFPSLDVKGLDAADSASYTNLSTQGKIDNGNDNNTVSLRLGSNLASKLNETLLIRYTQSNTSLDAYNSSFVLSDDPDYFTLQKQLMINSQSEWTLGEDWEQILNVSFVDDNRLYNGVPNVDNTYFEQGNFDGQTAQATWQNNVRLFPEETLVLGLQGQSLWASEWDSSGYTDVPAYDSSDSVVANAQLGTGFVESHTALEDQLFLDLSGRFDVHSQYGTHTTYQAGLAYYVPVLNTKLKANYGTAFLAPSLYELHDPNYGNPALLPETSKGWDLGFEQAIGKNFLSLGADYFDNNYTNLFQFVYTSYAPVEGENINIGTARTDGVESFITFTAVNNLILKGSYTYTYAENTANNMPLIQRPENKASGDIDYQWGKAGFGTSLIYVGNCFDMDFGGNQVVLPSYFLVNLRASYQVSSQIKLFARVDNLFNQWYEEVYGYSTPGLSAYGGTEVSF